MRSRRRAYPGERRRRRRDPEAEGKAPRRRRRLRVRSLALSCGVETFPSRFGDDYFFQTGFS
jgi:hypothetical protein